MRIRKTFLTSLALILAVTAATRLTFAWTEARKIPPDQLTRAVFQTEAGGIGRSLAIGKGFSSPFERDSGPTAILPPVYPLLVAGVFRIFGVQSSTAFYVLVLLNIAFATVTVIPLYEAGRSIGGARVAAIAGWLWALFPNGVVIPFEWIWETSLSAFLAALLLWTTLRLPEAEAARRRDWILYGLLWGLALMTNPALGAALPLLLAWAAWQAHKSRGVNLDRPALALLIALACCLPWTIRNAFVFHRFVPLRSGFGFELYIGNNENYAERQFVWPPRVSYERELLRYLHTGEMTFMDEERHKALSFISDHPRIAVRLFLSRVLEFWTGTPNPWQTWRTHPSAFERVLLPSNLLVPLFALAGLILLFLRQDSFAMPLLAFPLFFPIVYYLTHASLRYRHPIDPILFLLAAASIAPRRPTLSPIRPLT
jgi:Dolichyl-phosphate-mannose-protein mannosyltransferase